MPFPYWVNAYSDMRQGPMGDPKARNTVTPSPGQSDSVAGDGKYGS